METAHPLHPLIDLPGHFAEDLVVLGAAGEKRIRAWLTVGVAQVLIAAEEPGTIGYERTTKMSREVSVSHAGVRGLRFAASRARQFDRLAGQAGRLAVVRNVRRKKVSPLFGHHVEHTALDVAELRRRAKRIDVHFLNDVDVWLRLRTSGTWTREVGAVQQVEILVHTRTEDRHVRIGPARR